MATVTGTLVSGGGGSPISGQESPQSGAKMGILGCSNTIFNVANAACAFDRPEFPDHSLYSGNPWFLPVVGSYFRLRDRLDRLLA